MKGAAEPKLLKIRNFRGLSSISSDSLEAKLTKLESEIFQIFICPNYTTSLEELYRLAEDLFHESYNPLIQKLQTIIEAYIDRNLQDILKKEEEEIILSIDVFWREFNKHIRTITNIFLYYNRSPQFFKHNIIQKVTLLFSTVAILNPKVRQSLIGQLLGMIERERNGLPIDRTLIRSLIQMITSLQLYEEIFLEPFLKSSQNYYENESNKLILQYDIPLYLTHVNHRRKEEQKRVEALLTKETSTPLLDIIYKELVQNHSEKILDEGFAALINQKMFTELTLLYDFFQKITGGINLIVTTFKSYILKTGSSLTDLNTMEEKGTIQQVLEFHDGLKETIKVSFEDRVEFFNCIRISFKTFLNSHQNKIAQLLAKYLDLQMRNKSIIEEDLEVIVSKTIKLFTYIQSKDIFEAFYKKLLARRLLLGKSTSQDAENNIISKLKEECGASFTSNIEGMFQDMALSKSINVTFRQKSQINSDFIVSVLTNSYWPTYPNHEVNLPTELLTYQQEFQKFYLSNHNGRKLLWQPTLSHCLLKATFDCGVKELQVSLLQAVVLLLFNDSETISFREICELTNLEKNELKRTLLSLACGKVKVLGRCSEGKDIEDEEVFCFNPNFTVKLYRVKVNQVQLEETVAEEKETEKNVLVDRQFQIDAAIVRVMKKKKSIEHVALVKELYEVLDIPVNQSDLKRRIELLIERDYMKRDGDNKSLYVYIA